MRLSTFQIILAFIFSLASPTMAETQMRTIVVSGEGVVSAVPDMAVLTLGVSREARLADVALNDVADGVALVLERLDTAGIAPRDRQTLGLSLQPRWDRPSNGT
ncbi:MAG: SIMPL domain-containing protein, partial [Pseudomonadota bacterium]